jgi:hypothetical protein
MTRVSAKSFCRGGRVIGTAYAKKGWPRLVKDAEKYLADLVAGEHERWLLWAPVSFGIGVGVYFGLASEPPALTGISIFAAAGLVSWRLRANLVLALVLLGIAIGAAGFAAAQLRTHLVAAPVLEKSYGPAGVTGSVVRIEPRPDGPRVTLEQVSLNRIDAEATPALVRIKLRRGDIVDIGDRIDVFAKLSPPSAPASPGAYDFQRRSWFQGLGAVGFAMGRVRPGAGGMEESWSPVLFMTALRLRMSARIRTALPGESGAIAAALMTGDRSAISQESLDSMRDSGLAHLLAISGLHLGLVATTLFFGLRALLALSERLTLRHAIKKWAAVADGADPACLRDDWPGIAGGPAGPAGDFDAARRLGRDDHSGDRAGKHAWRQFPDVFCGGRRPGCLLRSFPGQVPRGSDGRRPRHCRADCAIRRRRRRDDGHRQFRHRPDRPASLRADRGLRTARQYAGGATDRALDHALGGDRGRVDAAGPGRVAAGPDGLGN